MREFKIIYVIGGLVMVACIAVLMYLSRQHGKDAQHKDLDIVLNAPIVQTVDDNGRNHATKETAALSKPLAEAVNKRLYDSVCHALGIAKRQIEDLRAIGSYTEGTIIPEARREDSACLINYKDPWFAINGVVCSGHDSLRYFYRDSLHITRYWQRSGLLGLGKKRHYLDAYSLNKNTVIQGLSGIDITDDSYDRIEVSGYGGYLSQYNVQAFNAGLELELSLSRAVSLDGTAAYLLQDGKLRPAFSGKVKIHLLKR